MVVNASNFRQNIFKMLDEVAQTGTPIEIVRKGVKFKIIAEKPKSKLANVKKRSVINCDPEELVHLDWSHEWKN